MVKDDQAQIDCGSSCNGIYGDAAEVGLTAIENLGSQFVQWQKLGPGPHRGCTGTTPSITITMGGDLGCEATFDTIPTTTTSTTTSTSSTTTSTTTSTSSTTTSTTASTSSTTTSTTASTSSTTTSTTASTSSTTTSTTTSSTSLSTSTTLPGGLRGDYFNGTDLSSPVLSRIDSNIDFGPESWGLNSPDPVVSPDGFSVRWTGGLRIDDEDIYTFNAISNDGIRLWIDGRLVLDHWNDGAVSIEGSISLAQGIHDLKVEYFENTGEAWTQIYWSSSSLPYEVIPSNHFVTPVINGSHPVLSWTGEPEYLIDGVDPQEGEPDTVFNFKVKYTDVNQDLPAPGFPRLHILKDGIELSSSPFPMSFQTGDPSVGSIYAVSLNLPEGTDYSYYFDARDITGLQAVSGPGLPSPFIPFHAPDVGGGMVSGDLDGSGRIDGFDLGLMGQSFGSKPGSPNWNSDADLNKDGEIDITDLGVLKGSFAKTN